MLRFYVNEVLSHVNVGELSPTTYAFGEPLAGIGEATMMVAIPDRLESNSLLQRIVPNKYELVITDGDIDRGAPILWAGWIDQRDPDPAHAVVGFHATHWKGWFYRRFIPPNSFANNFIEKDEHQIAYDLLDWSVSGVGTPVLYRPSTLAGKTRQLTLQPWASVGDSIDAVAKRDGGFEWSLGFRLGSQSGMVEILAEIWEPGAVRSSNTALFLDNTRTTNRINVGKMGEDGTIQAVRQYATSDGDAPVWAKDENPELASDTLLLLENVTTYQDNRNTDTLFTYARSERLERDNPYTTIPVTLGIDLPAVSAYRTGDRARLRMRDAWRNVDQSGIRIVDKSINKTDGQPPLVTVSLDMTDIQDIV